MEQAIDSIVVIDVNNDVVLFNRAAEQLWGRPRAEVLGRNVSMLVPDYLSPFHDGFIDSNRRTGLNRLVGSSREIPIKQKNGATRWGSMSLSRVKTEGEILYTAFIKDVTEQHIEQEHHRLLSMVADQTDNAIVILDDNWQIQYANNGFTKMFGFAADELIGQQPFALLLPHWTPDNVQSVRNHLTKGQAYCSEELACRRDGRRIWCSVTSNPVLNESGQLMNIVNVLTEITHSKMHEVLQHRMLVALAREEPIATVMEIVCAEIERVAPDVVTSVLRVDEERRLRPLSAPSLPHSYSQAIDGLPIGPKVGSCGTAAYLGETVVVRDIATDPLWDGYRDLVLPLGLFSCWSTPIKCSKGRSIGTLAFYYREIREPSTFHRQLTDVLVPLCALALEREETRGQIRRLAFYDSLTELPNRSLLQAKAELALSEAQRNHHQVAVFFLDIDRFKQINDLHGHPVGDFLLQTLAKRLDQQRKVNDIVGRLSSDEFVLVVPQCDGGQATELAEQLRVMISKSCDINGVAILPSASIGISLFPQDGHDIGTLLHRADTAMHQAKEQGRGRFSFFSHELNQLAIRRQAMERALHEAICTNQLDLHYQPQICMRNNKLHGVEVLARWRHSVMGDISPTCFIPLAEESGMIDQLSLWVIRKACRQLSHWRQRGFSIPMIAINLSATNFHDSKLPEMILRTLRENGLQPDDLTLELTEGVLMDTNPETMETVRKLHDVGVRLSMDDFGTGYSSLSYLRDLPIQELKLDRSFVRDLCSNATSRALSEAIARIGETLQLTVVAEGIEEEGQYQILQRQGYHVAQGYLFAKPLGAADFEDWMREGFSAIPH
ncbi:EAL domain-containing protein [uncultured Oxalicibacterium sp.]|uniref:EAL domain-containing protein n=1 Tax=uncultured Oxalicibacterium sp. TaxID=1168540 RepID=UPI0025F17B53|nr:EAL domain-containing protein [uncultured Oxalicibacterium sp.]